MNLNRKRVIWIVVGLTAAYFAKKFVEKRAVEKYKASVMPSDTKAGNQKLDGIKNKVYDLIEYVHYKYKSDELTDQDLQNYEKLTNYIVS